MLNTESLVDTYLCCDFFVPGVLLITGGPYPLGTADVLEGRSPDDCREGDTFASHAVTPLTDKTARYFYMFGRRPQGDETAYEITDKECAFAEDKAMIEAQQRNIDANPNARFIATSADKAIVVFNRLIEKLLQEEHAPRSSTVCSGEAPSPVALR
jgi:vanillate O-demethylase monooxygenase subunit